LLNDPRLKAYLEYLTLGSEIALSISAPIMIGYWLDTRFETLPVYTMSGVGLGIVLLIFTMVRLVRKFDGKEEKDDK